MERGKLKFQHNKHQPKGQQPRPEAKQANTYGSLWRDKQLRDYRKANNLCYGCGEKYEPGHAEQCPKRVKPQLNAMVVNDLDKEINEELLNEMAIDEMLTETFCQLSLNAMSGTDTGNSIKLKATVRNKTMLILVDTGSSHTFVSSAFVNLTQLPTTTMPHQKVQLANGTWMSTTTQVKNLEWYIQGHTLIQTRLCWNNCPMMQFWAMTGLRHSVPCNVIGKLRHYNFSITRN